MGSTRTLELPCCGPQQLGAGWKTLRKAAGIPAPANKGEGGARASRAGVIAGVRVGPEGHVVRQVRVWAGWDPRPALNTVSMERGRPCSNHHGPGRRGARRWHTPLLSRGSWQRGYPCLLRGLDFHLAMTSRISPKGHGWGQMFLFEG